MPLNLTFCIQRTDIESKSGGDLLQFLQLKQNLEEKGFKVNLIPWSPKMNLQKCEIVNLINDRPLILADSLRVINKLNPRPKVVVSPIHHSDFEVIHLRKYSFHETLLEFFLSNLLRINLFPKGVLHVIYIMADLRMISETYGVRVAVVTLLQNFKCVLSKKALGTNVLFKNSLQFLAKEEKLSFIKDYHLKNQKIMSSFIIPNGKPDSIQARNICNQDNVYQISVVGRIEPRKRSLELARLANQMGIPVTFVGSFANSKSKYALEFLKNTEGSEFVKFLGELPHKETIEVIAKSTVLLNVSFTEVFSLVELEAASQGKWIVSSGAGYSKEHISTNQLRIFPMNDIRKGLEIAFQLSFSKPPVIETKNILSWDKISDRYSAMYNQIMFESNFT